MGDAQIHRHYPAIAEELFGEHAYVDPGAENLILLLDVNWFMDMYMAKHWHTLHALFIQEQRWIENYRKDVDFEWDCKCKSL